jgi:hypothetical protein
MDRRLRQAARAADDPRLCAVLAVALFSDKGRERGLAVELVRDWERYLNLEYAKQLGNRPLTIYTGRPRATSCCRT